MAVITAERQAAISSELQNIVSQVDFNNYDFYSIKMALMQHLKVQYPNDFTDYFEDSVIMSFIETVSYLGEQLAYRQDMNINEMLPATSSVRDNVIDLYGMIGYESARPAASTGTVKLVVKYAVDGVTPLTDAAYIAGMPRWIFTPEITYATIGDLTQNGKYVTILPNHIPIGVSVGTETLSYELASTGYDLVNGLLVADTIETNALSVVFDGTNFICILQQGSTVTETFEQDSSEGDLKYVVSRSSCDQHVPFVSVGSVPWTYVKSLYSSQLTTQNSYMTTHDGSDRITVTFGDGISGAIPRGSISVTYRICDGIRGNILASAINTSVRQVANNPSNSGNPELIELFVTGNTAMSGGVDQESISTIKKHGPAVYASQGRQVSAADYEAAIIDVQGVSKVKVINRTYVGHDATGLYSSGISVGNDATTGTATSFTTSTSFNGARIGIDTITVIDPADILNAHLVTGVVDNGNGTWTVTVNGGMPASWTGNYMWKHWAANNSGGVRFPVSSTGPGTVVVANMIAGHVPTGSKVTVVDGATGNWYYSDPATDITFSAGPPVTATLQFRDGAGTISTVTPVSPTVFVDYTFSSDSTVIHTSLVTPAPDAAGDFFYHTTGIINIGDILWQTSTNDGYIVLDIEVGAVVGFDKIYVSRNTRNPGSPAVTVAGQTFTVTSYNRTTRVIQNPSKSNIIDAYILLTGADNLPEIDPTNTVITQDIENGLADTRMINDMVFVHWGRIKYLQIPITVYLKNTGVSSSEQQQNIQQAVYDYFSVEKANDWPYQDITFGSTMRLSPFIRYLHEKFTNIDYIDHGAFDSIDKTSAQNEILSADTAFAGVTIG